MSLVLVKADHNRSMQVAGKRVKNTDCGQIDLVEDRDKLYAEFTPLVCRLKRQYGDNAEIRSDLEGEIYYRFCVLLEAYDPRRGVPLRPYIVRQLSISIFNYAKQNWRHNRRELSLEMFTAESTSRQYVDPTSSWDDALDLEKFKRTLPAAFEKLSERQFKVLIWRYYDELGFDEIAKRLDIQATSVRSLLRHAINHLRADLVPTGS